MAHALLLASCALCPHSKLAALPPTSLRGTLHPSLLHMRLSGQPHATRSCSAGTTALLPVEWRSPIARARGVTMQAARPGLKTIWALLSAIVTSGWAITLLVTPRRRSRLLLRLFQVPSLAKPALEAYVERKSLEARVAEHVSQPQPFKYLVVVGPHGGGKSTMIKKVLGARSKVVYVALSKNVPTIASELQLGLRIPQDEKFKAVDVFRPFGDLKGAEKPVLVVELDSNVEAETVRTESQEVKLICVDNELAHGIIVLSDANAAFKLNPDPSRQDFLWVGDFEEHEMLAFLDLCGVLPARGSPTAASRALRRCFLDEVGARPQDVRAVARAARRAADKAVAELPEDAAEAEKQAAADAAEQRVFEWEIEAAGRRADNELANVLTKANSERPSAPGEFKRLLSLVCNDPHGVSPKVAPFTPTVAAELVKPAGMRVISFNMESERFQFYSRAHEKAAIGWFKCES